MDVLEVICGVIHELVGVPRDLISSESRLDELHLDSMDVEELVLEIEETFDVLIPDEKIDTVEQLVQLVSAA